LSTRKTVSVKDVEKLLVCLPGIQKARVVVNDWGAIEEIHIITGLGRNPKQIVRDVQSALKAQWDISVDRRKISVAQIRTGLPEPSGRLRYSGLEIKTDVKTGKCEVSVTLERPSEEEPAVYVGKAQADISENSILLGIAKATCLAVNLTVEPPNAFYPDDVAVIRVGVREGVAVLVSLVTPKRHHEELLGAALIRREVREACVRATLDALNRRLEVLPQRGSVRKRLKKEDFDTGAEAGGEAPLPHEPPLEDESKEGQGGKSTQESPKGDGAISEPGTKTSGSVKQE